MNMEVLKKLEIDRKSIMKRIMVLHTVKRKESVLELAHTGANSLAIRGDEWDKENMLLAVQNGVIDLRTGELCRGKPRDYIKTAAPVEYIGLGIIAPTWERFLNDIFDGNQGLVDYIQRLLGYGITGLVNHHVFPIFWGPHGRNGKGTILETLKHVLGELAYKTRAEMLLASRFGPTRGAADADTMAFRGKRIIWASETDDGRALNTERIKELCGGDTLNARPPYGKRTVEFSPTHLLILMTNNRPKVPTEDTAIWDRIHLIPFNIRFVDDPHGPNERRADHDLFDKLKAESSGILAWLVKGCLDWQRTGLLPPDIVKAANVEYRQDEDEIRQFLDEECDLIGSGYCTMGKLHERYTLWHNRMKFSGQKISMKKLSSRLVDMGFNRDDTGRNIIFHGIVLKSNEF